MLAFRLWRFPVVIEPTFWLVIAFLGASPQIGDMSVWLAALAIWILAAFVSVLVHELGHAVVLREWFGASPTIRLHAFGGVTDYSTGCRRPPRRFGRIAIAAAGPLAGFVLAFLCVGIEMLLAEFAPNLLGDAESLSHFGKFLRTTTFISIFWGILNLFPIFPLDGGQICREICTWFSPFRGDQIARHLSFVIAAALAASLLWRHIESSSGGIPYNAALFGFLAYQNYARRFR